MAEFTLPRNSQVRKDGRVFKAPAGAKNVRVFKVYRFDPDANENPRLDRYEIEPAERFTDKIEQALNTASMLIVVLSPNWVERP